MKGEGETSGDERQEGEGGSEEADEVREAEAAAKVMDRLIEHVVVDPETLESWMKVQKVWKTFLACSLQAPCVLDAFACHLLVLLCALLAIAVGKLSRSLRACSLPPSVCAAAHQERPHEAEAGGVRCCAT